MREKIEWSEIFKFLIKAREEWLLQEGKEKEKVSKMNCFWFSLPPFLYQRISYGIFQFFGIEIIFWQKDPIWLMSFEGEISRESEKDKVFSILREVLIEEKERARIIEEGFYGDHFVKEKEGFLFITDVRQIAKGEFLGKEEIWKNGERIYFLNFKSKIIL